MFYISFNKFSYDLLLIALKLTAVFGQYMKVKTKNQNENYENEIKIVWQFSSTLSFHL